MLENDGLLRRVVHASGDAHYACHPSCRQRPRRRKKRPHADRSAWCPDRPNLGWAPHAALFAALLPLLADCGPARNQFAPPCPGPAIVGDAADYDIYRDSGTSRGASDLTDPALHARIVGIQGSCREGDQKNRLAVTVGVTVELNRGPAMQGREAEVPVFVAVTEGNSSSTSALSGCRSCSPPTSTASRWVQAKTFSCRCPRPSRGRGAHDSRRLPTHA